MKNIFLLLAGALFIFSACSKDSADPVVPTPVVGDGTGKFTFSMDTANYRVDTLLVSYRGRDGQVKTQTLIGQNNWSSPDLVFKAGDSIRADVQAFGSTNKSFPVPPEGVIFEVYPSLVAVPSIKRMGGENTTPVTDRRFQHRSSKFLVY